jgi:hypothetical protein
MQRPTMLRRLGGAAAALLGVSLLATVPSAGAGVDGPQILTSTLAGGWFNAVTSIAVDAQGRVYLAGDSDSNTSLPTTPGAFQEDFRGGTDGFIVRLSADLSRLEYATYLGSGGTDRITALTVDGTGQAVVVGTTASPPGFPQTPNTFRPDSGAISPGFVTKLSADGSSLVYSAFLGVDGGSTEPTVVTADDAGRVWIAGRSNSDWVPPTPGAYVSPNRGGWGNGFVMKVGPTGRRLGFSSIIGGSGFDQPNAIAVSDAGVFVGGATTSADLPTTRGAAQRTHGGQTDGFLAQLSPNGKRLLAATFLGSRRSDVVTAIAIDGTGVYSTGETQSRRFPVTPRAFQASWPHNVVTAPFVTKHEARTFTMRYSTFLSGTNPSRSMAMDRPSGIVARRGRATVVGTAQTDFPTTVGALQSERAGVADGFISRLGPRGGELRYSSLLGGTGPDVAAGLVLRRGRMYVGGYTGSPDYPTTPDTYQPSGDCSNGCPFATVLG